MRYLALFIINIIVPITLIGQEVVVDPDDLANVLDGDWDTYSGDYSGRRYSNLDQVHKENVSDLTLAWTTELNFNIRRGNIDGTGIITKMGGEGRGDIDIRSGSIKGKENFRRATRKIKNTMMAT